jgi:hypothetical protein
VVDQEDQANGDLVGLVWGFQTHRSHSNTVYVASMQAICPSGPQGSDEEQGPALDCLRRAANYHGGAHSKRST